MAMKRSFDHDRDPSNTNSFESRTSSPSNKRPRRFFPMTVVSSPTTATMTNETTEPTVFPDIQPISNAGEKKKPIKILFPISLVFFALDVLLTRIKEEFRRLQRRHQLKVPSTSDQSDEDTTANQNETRSAQHLLTLKQVNMICARLLKEREEKLREEYDRILSNQLSGESDLSSILKYLLFRFAFRTIRRLCSIYSRSAYTKIF